MKKVLTLIIVLFLFISCTKEIPDGRITFTNLRGEYLGQTPPDTIPQIFASGVVSTGLFERDAAFMPGGEEFYFSIWQSGRGAIVVMKKENGRWTNPYVTSFSGMYSDFEPFITHDGSKIFFISNRPLEGGEPKDYDIWYAERDGNKWGDPVNLGAPVNSEYNEFYPSLTRTGDLYFTSNNPKSMGAEDIFVSRYINGVYQEPVNLGDSVNSMGDEFNSFISPDGDYLLYTTYGERKGIGGGDLWVSFNINDSTWTFPRNLGENINTEKLEYCPYVTPDGKYLFFTSNRVNGRVYRERVSYEQLVEEYNNPYNGVGDLYWVSTKVIQKLK